MSFVICSRCLFICFVNLSLVANLCLHSAHSCAAPCPWTIAIWVTRESADKVLLQRGQLILSLFWVDIFFDSFSASDLEVEGVMVDVFFVLFAVPASILNWAQNDLGILFVLLPFLPFCPFALLPFCPFAILPFCPFALLPFSLWQKGKAVKQSRSCRCPAQVCSII